MFLKLDELQEIGRFASLKHKAPHFAQLSLVYARNGYGKSTMSAVVRSAAENKPEYISARRKLDATNPCLVKSTWALGSVNFNGGTWSGATPKTYVFDQDFVQQNVHVGDSVTRDIKRSLLPVVLGEEGVKLGRKVVDLDQEQRECATTRKEQANQIKQRHPSIDNVGAYCSVPIPADIDTRVAAAARAEELARQTVAVREKSAPKSIQLAGIETFRAVASATIDTLSGDVAARVRDHIEKHYLGSSGDRWVKYGVEHQRTEDCPFCGQSTRDVDIVEAFRAYYSEGYARLVADRDSAIAEVRSLLGAADSSWRATADANDKDFEFWGTVADLPLPPVLNAGERDRIDAGLNALDKLLATKVTNPLAVVTLDVSEIEDAFELISRYNSGIGQAAASIEAAKQAVQFANLPQAQTQHAKLRALVARQSEPMQTLAAEYLATETRAAKLLASKEAAQLELTTYAPATIAARQAIINALLALFGTDYRIVDAKANFVGREPNTDFAISIGNGKIAAGERSNDKPSFKTVLSSADKTTLALAFFLTQIRADPAIGDAVIVFDDPFNSQDLARQFETSSQIRAVATQAAQVLVLSHDPRFLHMIENDARVPMITLQLQCTQKGEGSITTWCSADELKDLYVRNSEIIREYAGHGTLLKNVNELTVLQAVRPFLEDYIRARFPGRFGEMVMLDAMTTAIEDAGNSDPLFACVGDLRALNEYTRPNMHGGGQAPHSDALRAQCQRVVSIIGTY